MMRLLLTGPGRLVLAALAVVAAGYVAHELGERRGREAGRAAAEAECAEATRALEQRLAGVTDDLRRTADRLADERRAREQQVEDLENAARSAAGADRQCLDAGGVRRLERRWSR